MKKSFLATLSVVVLMAGNLFGSFTFDFGTMPSYGSGENVSAFVVDWNNGASNEVIAWAYRWDTSTTLEMMMEDLAGSPGSNLFVRWDSDAGFGAFLFGLGYQNGANSFSVNNAVDFFDDPAPADFIDGVWDIHTNVGWEPPDSFTAVAANLGDFYAEGFIWTSYVAGSTPDFSTSTSQSSFFAPVDWTATSLGISGVTLVNEGWYGFGRNRAPDTIPEPSSSLLIVLSSLLLASRRRK